MAMLQAIANNFSGIQGFLDVLAIIIGACFIVHGIYRLANFAHLANRGEGAFSPTYELIAGAALCALPTYLTHASETLLTTASGLRTALDYENVPTVNQAAALLTVLVGVITLWGYYATLRGWVMFASLSNPKGSRQHSIWGVLVFLGAGALAANFMLFTDDISASLGVHNFLNDFVTQ